MNRVLKWILAIIGILLSTFSLYTIYISGKPTFDSYNTIGWIGFVLGFCILMALLYYLSVKVGIAYTIILLLLLLFMIIWDKFQSKHTQQQNISQITKDISSQKNSSDEIEQLYENGDIVISHPYDHLISLQWGTLNNVDMDLMLISSQDNVIINFSTPKYSLDASNSIWLDYDYQMQQDIATKEIISILGMKNKTFSIITMNYNGEKLEQDVVVDVSLLDGTTATYTIPAEYFNDDTNCVYVCDIILNTNEIIEVMKDFDSGGI